MKKKKGPKAKNEKCNSFGFATLKTSQKKLVFSSQKSVFKFFESSFIFVVPVMRADRGNRRTPRELSSPGRSAQYRPPETHELGLLLQFSLFSTVRF